MTMRDEFEAWYVDKLGGNTELQQALRADLLRTRDGDGYADDWDGLAERWVTWQAATETAAKKCDGLVYAIDNGGNQYRREASASRCAAAIRGKGE